jgi:hypothetical protein
MRSRGVTRPMPLGEVDDRLRSTGREGDDSGPSRREVDRFVV